jgi:hypothetical protein
MKTKAVGVFSSRASLPSGGDSPRPAAVQGAAEPRHSEPCSIPLWPSKLRCSKTICSIPSMSPWTIPLCSSWSSNV